MTKNRMAMANKHRFINIKVETSNVTSAIILPARLQRVYHKKRTAVNRRKSAHNSAGYP